MVNSLKLVRVVEVFEHTCFVPDCLRFLPTSGAMLMRVGMREEGLSEN
jgi:hypothetical protein